jgi:regulator of RNase E activity RraA
LPNSEAVATSENIEELEQFDTCTLSNTIEQFDIRTRNEGFVNGRCTRCFFPEMPTRAAYAVTARIRTSATPITGRCYYDRPEWWSYVASIPAPRFIVTEDVDNNPGLGALFGEIHARISVALSCSAYLTNGAVRDLPGIRDAGLQVFAGNVSVSHAYAHLIQFGEPVEIGGLKISPGDLLVGDKHGVLSVPTSLASQIPARARQLQQSESELIAYCQSQDFSLDTLARRFRLMSEKTASNDIQR